MSRWEQNAVFEYSEYICLVKRINGIVAQKTLVTELVRCKECRYKDMEICPMYRLVVAGVRKYDDFCSYGEREGE